MTELYRRPPETFVQLFILNIYNEFKLGNIYFIYIKILITMSKSFVERYLISLHDPSSTTSSLTITRSSNVDLFTIKKYDKKSELNHTVG